MMKQRNLHLPPGARCQLITDCGDHWKVWLAVNRIDDKPGSRFGTCICLYTDGSAITLTVRPDGEEEREVMESNRIDWKAAYERLHALDQKTYQERNEAETNLAIMRENASTTVQDSGD